MKIKILDEAVVTPENLPANHNCCFSPSSCKTQNGEVVVIYRQGATKHSRDGVLISQSSTNQGRTWSRQSVIFNGLTGAPALSVHAGGVCRSGNGSLLAFFTAVPVENEDAYIFSDQGRQLKQQLYMARSTDGGANWSTAEAREVEGAPPLLYINSRPVLLPDKRILVPFEATAAQGQQIIGNAIYCPVTDKFSPFTIVAQDSTGEFSYGDARLSTAPDGRIQMLIWAFITKTEETLPVRRCFSVDGGKNWSPLKDTGIPSQITTPLDMGGGHIIAAANVRSAPQGIRLWHSADGGESWDLKSPLQLWDLNRQKVLGEVMPVGEAQEQDASIWNALPDFSFGMPDLVRFEDNTVLLTYYVVNGDKTQVRACRFAVDFQV
jgi:hypothetical protein